MYFSKTLWHISSLSVCCPVNDVICHGLDISIITVSRPCHPGGSWYKASVQTDEWLLLFHKLLTLELTEFLICLLGITGIFIHDLPFIRGSKVIGQTNITVNWSILLSILNQEALTVMLAVSHFCPTSTRSAHCDNAYALACIFLQTLGRQEVDSSVGKSSYQGLRQ